MDAATGHLLYIGEVASKIHKIQIEAELGGIKDGVLIAFDAEKTYLKPEMTDIPVATDWKNLRDLNE